MPTTTRTAPTHAFVLALVALALPLVVGTACSSERRDVTSARGRDASEAPAGPRVRPATDLSAVARNAVFAFRRDPSAAVFTMGSDTFESRVASDTIHVTPRRRLGATPPMLAAEDRGTTLSLQTSRISRGATALPRLGGTTLEADGSVSILHGDVAERIESDGTGVEQSWRFERVPSGEGDLVVRVRVTGQRFRGVTDHGLHFVGGDLGLRYGTATWIDAGGARTVVTPTFANGEISLVVPSSVLAKSRFPAVLDPTISPEIEIDMPIAGGSASGEQTSPVIKPAPGGGYFAIWFDRRGLRPSIYGTRLDTANNVLDNTGIVIASGIGASVPSLAPSSDGYIVTWAIPYIDTYQAPGVYAVRLGVDGKPADPAPVAIAASAQNLQAPTAAFDGTNWLVAWQGYGGSATSYDIFAARLPRTGPSIDATPIPLSKQPLAEYSPLVFFDGADYLVAWRSGTQIIGQKMGLDGSALGAPLVLATTGTGTVYEFSGAFDGSQYAFVWREYRAAPTLYDIYARRIDKSGTPADPTNVAIAADTNQDYLPRVAFDGTNYLITWRRLTTLMTRRLPLVGGPIDPTPIKVADGAFTDYTLASDRTASIVLSREQSGSTATGNDIKGLVIAKTPAAGGPMFIASQAGNSETLPCAAFDGLNHHVIWLDTRDGLPSIYGATVAPDGTPQAPIKLVSDVKYTAITSARIEGDAKGSLVVFTAVDKDLALTVVRGLRLGVDGRPTGAEIDVRIPPAANEVASEVSLALDGTNYLVAWTQRSSDGQGIVGERVVAATGAVLDTEPVRISTVSPNDYRATPSVAYDGTNFFVAWSTSRYSAADIEVSHIYGTRVSREAATLDGELVVCDAFLLQRSPQVAGDPKNHGFFVVWEDYRTALETADVYGTRISAEGQNTEGPSGTKIAGGAHDESRPRVANAGDGSNWLVAWRDLRSKEGYDLYGAWVSLAGKNHDPDGVVLSADTGDEDAPWLSASGNGKMLLVYQRLDPRVGYGSYRLRARAIGSGALVGATCATTDDCVTRTCADGFCCATECGGCGVCNAEPGTCTPRPAGSESPTCAAYKCKGTLDCPTTCETDADCGANATCDPNSKTCVSRVLCIDDRSLKDLSGNLTECAPYKCQADACRTQCGSVDDCSVGFVCDLAGRCVQPPGVADGACAMAQVGSSSDGSGGALALCAMGVAMGLFRSRRRRHA